MRAPLFVSAATAALVLLAGMPAEAGCIGCGGTAAPGSGHLTLTGLGSVYPAAHKLTTSCSYESTPSGGGYVGVVRAEVLATSVFGEPINVQVSCTVYTTGGQYSVTAGDSNDSYTPYEAHAATDTQARPLEHVRKICLSASASYPRSHDGASAQYCLDQTFMVAEKTGGLSTT